MIFRRLITPAASPSGSWRPARDAVDRARGRPARPPAARSGCRRRRPRSRCASIALTSLTAGVSSEASRMSSRWAAASKSSSTSASGPRRPRSACGRASDRALEVARVGDGEPHVEAEREAQVVRAADVRRVGDRDEQQVVARGSAPGAPGSGRARSFWQQVAASRVDLGLGEVDVLEPVLLGERLREVAAVETQPCADDDLAEALGRSRPAPRSACSSWSAVSRPRAIEQASRGAASGRWAASTTPCIGNIERRHEGRCATGVPRRAFGSTARSSARSAPGLCVLLGVARGDGAAEAVRLAGKVARLRIFEDEEGRFDRSAPRHRRRGARRQPVHAARRHARRATGRASPRRRRPSEAEPLYERSARSSRELGVPVETGVFGARMEVELVNDGPVTIVLGRSSSEGNGRAWTTTRVVVGLVSAT